MNESVNDQPRAVSESGSPGRASDLLTQLGSRFPQVEIPEGVLAYVREQESNEHRIRRSDTGEPLDLYLRRIGIHREIITRVLDEDSRLVSTLSYPSLLDRSVDEVRARLEEHFAAVFVVQQAVLDSEVLTGFNRHGRDHLRSVSDRMLGLIREGSHHRRLSSR
jgi:hypothetical protein